MSVHELTMAPGSAREGGNSELVRCAYRRREYLYKKYTDEYRSTVDDRALLGLVSWRRELRGVERTRLDQVSAWPRRLVVDRSGTVRGVLMVEADRRFHRPGLWDVPQPRTVDEMTRPRADHVDDGQRVSAKQRAVTRTAEAILWLHALDVVVNDVRAENILVSEDGSAVHLVDCDTMLGPWGQPAPPQAPEYVWRVVPHGVRPNRTTDLARLGWLAIWLLLDDFAATSVPAAALAGAIGLEGAAALVTIATVPGAEPPPELELRQLLASWAGSERPVGRVTVNGAHPGRGGSPESAPTTPVGRHRPVRADRVVVRRRQPHEWVPSQFREPLDALTLLNRPQGTHVRTPGPRRRWVALLLAGTGLALLAAFEVVREALVR